MAFKKWHELPVSVRRSRKELYEYIVGEITSESEDEEEPVITSADVSFTVTDGENPVASATVSIADGKTGTTGSAGGCSISNVNYGEYTLAVTAEGYESYSETITVDADHTSFNVTLTATQGTQEEPRE